MTARTFLLLAAAFAILLRSQARLAQRKRVYERNYGGDDMIPLSRERRELAIKRDVAEMIRNLGSTPGGLHSRARRPRKARRPKKRSKKTKKSKRRPKGGKSAKTKKKSKKDAEDGRTPEGDADSPEGDADSPEGDADSPEEDADSPEGDTDSPDGDTDSPDGDGDTDSPDGDGDTDSPDGDGDTDSPDGDTDSPDEDGDTDSPDGDGDTDSPDGDGDTDSPDGDGDGDTDSPDRGDFDIGDCDSYNMEWLTDLAKTCDAELDDLSSCDCSTAADMLADGTIECADDTSSPHACPDDCPVCQFCLVAEGCPDIYDL